MIHEKLLESGDEGVEALDSGDVVQRIAAEGKDNEMVFCVLIDYLYYGLFRSNIKVF